MPFTYFSDMWEDCAKKSPFSSRLELGLLSLLKVTLRKALSTQEAEPAASDSPLLASSQCSTVLPALLSSHWRVQSPFNCTTSNDNKDRLWKLHVYTRS